MASPAWIERLGLKSEVEGYTTSFQRRDADAQHSSLLLLALLYTLRRALGGGSSDLACLVDCGFGLKRKRGFVTNMRME